MADFWLNNTEQIRQHLGDMEIIPLKSDFKKDNETYFLIKGPNSSNRIFLNEKCFSPELKTTIEKVKQIKTITPDNVDTVISKIDPKYIPICLQELKVHDSPTFIKIAQSINKSLLKFQWVPIFLRTNQFQKTNKKQKEALIEVAKLAAQQNGYEVSANIQKYNIQDQTVLIEIAKLAAQQDGGGTSAYIQNYGIQDQAALIEIAKLSAQQDGGGTSAQIQNYGIQDQAALIEIAKLAAQQNGGLTSAQIQNYGIQDQAALIEIAKLAAQQSGGGTSAYIQNYGIEDQAALIDIAKLAAQQNGYETSTGIHNYSIDSPEIRCYLYLECLSSDLNSHMERFEIVKENATYFLDKDPTLVTFDDIDRELTYFKKIHPSFVSERALEKIEALRKEQDTTPSPALIHSLRWLMIAATLQTRFFPSVKDASTVWETILEYPDPKMRYRLLQSAFQVLTKPYQLPDVKHARLPDLLLKEFGINGLQEKIKKQRIFRDGKFLKLLLDTLVLLNRSGLSSQEIENILSQVLESSDKNQLKMSFQLLQGIVQCGLGKELQSGEPEHLKSLFQKAFIKMIPVQSKDFADRYIETFKTQRDEASLLLYAGRHANSQEILNYLGHFVDSVIENQFPAIRYQGEHLDRVFSLRPDLKDPWSSLHLFDLQAILQSVETISDKPFSYLEFFRQKILTDHHLPHSEYPVLIQFLKDPQITPALQENDVQQKIIQLIKDSPLPIEQQRDRLLDIKNSLSNNQFTNDFIHDIEGAITGLIKVQKNTKDLKMILTDDYWDLFRCGTEVAGSCQRLDGTPDLNKCLLAYVMDGKNKILEIKDANQKICARAILRLLIDEKTQTPVLFLERIYANAGIEQNIINALESGAKQLAKKWNIPLYTDGDSSVQLVSLGSPAPWEYVDAAAGVHKNGKYKIITAKPLFVV